MEDALEIILYSILTVSACSTYIEYISFMVRYVIADMSRLFHTFDRP